MDMDRNYFENPNCHILIILIFSLYQEKCNHNSEFDTIIFIKVNIGEQIQETLFIVGYIKHTNKLQAILNDSNIKV